MEQKEIPSNDEITLKELILKVIEYKNEILKHWYIIAMFAIPISGFLFYKAYKSKLEYPAKLTFMLSQDEGGLGGIGKLLGSFGFGGSSGKNNYDKMIEIAKSKLIINRALFEKLELNGKTDFIANHIIDLESLRTEGWKKDTTGLSTFSFTKSDIPNFSRLESKALLKVFGIIAGTKDTPGIYNCSLSKDSEILSMSLITKDETLSIEFLKIIFSTLSQFYIETAVEKELSTYNIIKRKSDSIYNLMNSKDYAVAKIADSKKNLFEESSKYPSKRLNRDVQMLGMVYGESAKNTELADFSLKSKTPIIQELDMPMGPLEPEKKSKLKALLTGALLGTLIGSFLIIFRKIIREAMA